MTDTLAPPAPARPASQRPPLWRDVRVLAWLFQFAVVAGVIGLILWLAGNLRARGLNLDFSYLDRPAGFPIADTTFSTGQRNLSAVWIGLLNTGRLIVAGMFFALILGTLVGIARLSSNFLVSRAAKWYVEIIRNIPLLLIFLIAYYGISISYFPDARNSTDLAPWLIVNRQRVGVPWYIADTTEVDLGIGVWRMTPNWKFVVMLLAVTVTVLVVRRWRTKVGERVGGSGAAGVWSAGAALIVAVALWLLFGMRTTTPSMVDGGLRPRMEGGIGMTIPYFAALAALVVYTSSHIAEIVRGSIQAVHKGQGEAANALALSGGQRMRFIILPQAMRIALPAIGNQFLNLTKNSSLAAVVTFPELTKVTQLGIAASSMPQVPPLFLLLGVYLVLSLVISTFVNLVNRRLAIVER